ncbi:hypothetical protein F4808DRAFT_26611 [Astrocystis sublimbata]|nr:hypothetical protein F4808DRAFT_26611 [Astrocystis sublimbata]
MRPSLSAIERGNPPPRRKSCAACIKTKRRCDARQPSCSRCSQRKIECLYAARTEPSSQNRSEDAATPLPTVVESNAQPPDFLTDALPDMAITWESNFDFNLNLNPSFKDSCPSFSTIPLDETATIPGLEFLDNVDDMDSAMAAIPPTPAPQLGLPDSMPVVVWSPSLTTSNLSRVQLLRAASEWIEKHLRYAINTFRGAPESMVQEGGTPWSHPALYRDSMPSCLEDALGACALHRAKNPDNMFMIQRVIERRYQKLLSTPIPTSSVSEMMARMHALILYQIMIFFDDSSTGRALAEETIYSLGETAQALIGYVQHDLVDDDDSVTGASRDIPLFPLTTARALYSDWTFHESLRRTILVSILFTQLQSVMRADFSTVIPSPSAEKPSSTTTTFASDSVSPPADMAPPGAYPCTSGDVSTMAAIKQAFTQAPHGDTSRYDTRAFLCRNLTLSAHLWKARDPVEFAIAWRTKKHLVAPPWNFWKLVQSAEPDDVDQLGRILMTSGMGIDEAKGWFASKGSTL